LESTDERFKEKMELMAWNEMITKIERNRREKKMKN
jgi:hypothetical protein